MAILSLKSTYDRKKLRALDRAIEVDGRLGEIEKYLSTLFLKDPDFYERFEPWLEQEKKLKKLAEMGKRK